LAKDLQTSVILETKTAEAKLKALVTAINKVDDAINKVGSKTNNLSQGLQKSISHTKRLQSVQQEVTREVKKTNSAHKKTSSLLDEIGTKLKRMAGTYLGIMGMSAIIGASDTITKSENKLNQINGGNTKATQAQMDAMYSASQRSRMGYGDMMSNVSKSMTLSPDAFGGDMNAAIAFQEVMAKSYALGGASQAEQSSSMYQMIQALGSGKLAGDELRSVTEGAPLAAKQIEKFAQEIYKTDEALKDMGSKGMITSEIVVAAMLSAGNEIDKKFEDTAMTFEQAWQRIKNTAMKAFEPVLQKMNQVLNSKVGQSILNGIGRAIEIVANVLNYLFTKLEDVYNYIVDNWETIRTILLILASILATKLLITTGQLVNRLVQVGITAMASGVSWLVAWWPLVLLVGVLIFLVYQWAKSTQTATDFIYSILYGLAMGIIAILAIVLIAYLATGTIMLSIPVLIALLVIGVIAVLIAVFLKYTGEVVGGVYGIWEVIKAVVSWINTAWENMCNSLAGWFWNAVADMLEGVEWLLNGINKIREALGKDAISVGDIRSKAESYTTKVVENKIDIGSAWRTGYDKGYAIGEGIQNKINESGEKLKGLINGGGFGNSGLPSGGSYSYNPAALLGDIADADGKTAKNTGKMADSMELAAEDLELLYNLAEMEWKKEFTTANITVDMSNYNTFNGTNDYEGFALYVRDVIAEEASAVANGAYSFG
jgi:tape measure domain-containing protein